MGQTSMSPMKVKFAFLLTERALSGSSVLLLNGVKLWHCAQSIRLISPFRNTTGKMADQVQINRTASQSQIASSRNVHSKSVRNRYAG
jgi:hypothetical protein